MYFHFLSFFILYIVQIVMLWKAALSHLLLLSLCNHVEGPCWYFSRKL